MRFVVDPVITGESYNGTIAAPAEVTIRAKTTTSNAYVLNFAHPFNAPELMPRARNAAVRR